MSILKSIIETIYNDASLFERSELSKIVHGDEVVNPKNVGKAQGFSLMRAFLGAVGSWIDQNPNANPSDVPQSFHPELNTTIKDIMYPTQEAVANSNDEDAVPPAPVAGNVVETVEQPAAESAVA